MEKRREKAWKITVSRIVQNKDAIRIEKGCEHAKSSSCSKIQKQKNVLLKEAKKIIQM